MLDPLAQVTAVESDVVFLKKLLQPFLLIHDACVFVCNVANDRNLRDEQFARRQDAATRAFRIAVMNLQAFRSIQALVHVYTDHFLIGRRERLAGRSALASLGRATTAYR